MTDTQDMNLMQLFEDFDTDKECREFLETLRWPDGIKCPNCQSPKISRMYERKQFDCDGCGYQFSATAGTIFHDSHLPLPKWFVAVYLMCESKKGISANQLKRTIKVSYKTAWYLCHRIRKAMDEAKPLPVGSQTIVEIDETYIGGHKRHVGEGFLGNKTMVLGAVERGGPIRLKVERRKKATKKMLHRFVLENTSADTKRYMTDENPGYKGIADADTTHESVNHHAEEWVRGDVHTNSVEGVWSLFKRSIIGSYHQISAKHLQSYVDEFEWRFNGRRNPFLFRDTMLKLVNATKMEYKELIDKSA
jgi:transposase-like protein